MRKILHITGSLDRNGTETFIMNVYRHIDRNDIQFDFLLFTQSIDGYYEEAESLGAKIYRLHTRRNGLINYFKELYHFFKLHASEYRGIHFSACSLTTILPVFYAMLFHIPIRIVHAHSTSWEGIHNYILHKVNRLILPFIATDFLACSKGAAKWFYPFFIRKRSIVIQNGIETKKYSYNLKVRDEIRSRLNLNNHFVIGHVGRFVEVKNHKFLLEVFQKVLQKNVNAKLVLVGDGELRPEIEKLAKDLDIDSHILFLGQRNDVGKVMQAFDCFVLPSLYEGLPFVLLEAQCCGLKVLASTAVSSEAKLTNNIYILKLDQGLSTWCDYILHFMDYFRVDESNVIASKGYSIENTIKRLTKLYLR